MYLDLVYVYARHVCIFTVGRNANARLRIETHTKPSGAERIKDGMEHQHQRQIFQLEMQIVIMRIKGSAEMIAAGLA